MEQVYSNASIQINTEKEGYAKHNKNISFFNMFLKVVLFLIFFIVHTHKIY